MMIESYEKGIMLIREGRDAEAVGEFEKAISETGRFEIREHARMLLGYALTRLERWDEAIEVFDEVIANDPDCSSAYTALGHSLLMSGKKERAVRIYKMAVARWPDSASARHGLGYALLESGGDLDEALYQCQEALRLEPDSAAARDSLGWVLYHRGEIEGAAEHLARAVDLEPDHPVIVFHWRTVRDILEKERKKDGE